MIVVDTNIICYRWMPSPSSPLADKAWEKDPDWIAPFLWRSEFRNVLAGALRKKLIDAAPAIAIIDQAETDFAGREYFVSSAVVMRLVARSRCSAYDCEFVALAQEEGVSLLTADRDILRDFPDVAVPLEKFTGR